MTAGDRPTAGGGSIGVAVDDVVDAIAGMFGGGPAARLVGEALVAAELVGEQRFGLEMLDEIELPTGPCSIDRDVVGRLDAGVERCFGPLAVALVTEYAVESAIDVGVGVGSATGVGRLGRLAPYVRWGADRGVITVVLADAPPAVRPVGGTRAVLGTNPVAFAVPGGELVADFATSEGTMFGSSAVRGPDGAIPLLEPRGGVIGMLAGLLVATLTGGVTGRRPSREEGRSVTTIAIRPDQHGDDGATARWARQLLDDLLAAGGRIPGASAIHTIASAATVDVDPARCRRLATALGLPAGGEGPRSH